MNEGTRENNQCTFPELRTPSSSGKEGNHESMTVGMKNGKVGRRDEYRAMKGGIKSVGRKARIQKNEGMKKYRKMKIKMEQEGEKSTG